MKQLHIRPYHNSDTIKFVKTPTDEQDRQNTIKEISGYGLPVEISDQGIASIPEFQIETVDGWYPDRPFKLKNLKLAAYPTPLLMNGCKQHWQNINELVVKETVFSMIPLMYMAGGIGLAANQVGFDCRVFVMDENFVPHKENKITPKICFEPNIRSTTRSIEFESKEGCLSVPGVSAFVLRRNEIELTYITFENTLKTEVLGQFGSTIAQHEVYHLDGYCIHEHLSDLDRIRYSSIAKKLRQEDRKKHK